MGGKSSCVAGKISEAKRGWVKSRKLEVDTTHFRELGEGWNDIGCQNGHHNLENLPRLNVTAGDGVKHDARPMEERAREHCIRMYCDTENEGIQLCLPSGWTE
jgi:hypothetical protein